MLTVSPGAIAMLVGDERPIRVADEFGATPSGLAWTVSDSTVAEVVTDGVTRVRGLAAGIPLAVLERPSTRIQRRSTRQISSYGTTTASTRSCARSTRKEARCGDR